MGTSIKGVFELECPDLQINLKLIDNIQKYQIGFVNKNADHIQFFGGHLMGVQVVRFTEHDRLVWFDEIMEIYPVPLEEQLRHLPAVNAEWFISSDTLNLSCVWLVHAIYSSHKLNDEQKHNGMINVLLILQYKFLTSLLAHYFKYPADAAVAEATYAQLSNKFVLKQVGSWGEVLRNRAEDIIAHHSIHYKTITEMRNDNAVIYMLNDIQGRVRDIVKNIYAVFIRVHSERSNRITATSSVIEHDGVEILKDKSRTLLAYTRYLNSIVTDKNSFIRSELTVIIERMMDTMPVRLFHQTLEWMSHNYRQSGADEIEFVLTEALIHSFSYLSEHKSSLDNTSDLPGLLTRLKGVYMASRSTDPALLALREKTESIVFKATHSKSQSLLASTRTGVLLYLVLRTMTMRHYTS